MKQKVLKFLRNKWTLIVAGVLVIALAGTATAITLFNRFGKAKETEAAVSDIFWNVNRFDYIYNDGRVNKAVREKDKDDGTYHVLFSNLSQQGRAVNRRVKSSTIVSRIDMNTAMGLKFDEGGVVVDVIPLEDLGYTISTSRIYVVGDQEIGKPVVLNTSDRGDGIETKVTIPATVPIYDLSGTSGDVGTRVDKLSDGDCIFIMNDKEGKMAYVLIYERNVVGTIYYNKDRMYDSRFRNTTRTPNARGYYEFELAYEGKVETFYTKDYTLANYMDRTAGRAFGLELDEEDPHLIVDYLRTKEVTKGNIVASYYNVESINKGSMTFKYTGVRTSPKFGDVQTYSLSNNCRAMDVTGVDGTTFGEWTDVRVGDKVQCYLNGRGKICFIHVIGSRTVDSDLYWSVSRKWNTKTNTWTRKPEADGRYVFKVIAKNNPGVVKEVWTYNATLAQEIDKNYAAPVFGLKLNGNEIVKHYKPIEVVGGNSIASYYKITSINGKKIELVYPKNGKKVVAEMIDKPLVLNTQNLCKPDTIAVGDKVHSFLNSLGEIQIIYIIEKAPTVVKTAYCPHCKQNVTWYKFTGGTANTDGMHYCLTEDYEAVGDKAALTVGSGNTLSSYTTKNIVLDLAGHKIISDYRGINITTHNNLYLMDSKGGGVIRSTNTKYTDNGFGVLVGQAAGFTFTGGTIDMSGIVQTGCSGPCVYVSPGATFNMSGGTIKGCTARYGKASTLSGKTVTGGAIGGSVYVLGPKESLKGATFNMSGGTITGGRTEGTKNATGGNVTIASGATFNMSGGTITGGSTTGRGANVFLAGNMNLSGNAKVTNGTLYFSDKGVMNVGNMKSGASVAVEKLNPGVFANNVSGAESKAGYFTGKDKNYIISGDNDSKTLSIEYVGTEHVHAANGASDGEMVYYKALTQAMVTNNYNGRMPTTGNYYLAENITVTAQSSNTGDINLCFNGHTVSIVGKNQTSDRIYMLGNMTPEGMDKKGATSATVCFCDCKGSGGMKKTDASSNEKGSMLLVQGKHKVTLNIYGGTYDASGVTSTESGNLLWVYGPESKEAKDAAVVNIYDADFIGGTSKGKTGGTIYGDAKLVTINILGGTIEGGSAKSGGNIGGYATLNIKDATIKNGSAEIGGNIYLAGSETVKLENATITGGQAEKGGNIYIAGKNISFTAKDSEITDGLATADNGVKGTCGDNIYVENLTVTLEGDMVFDGVDNDKTDIYLESDNAIVKLSKLSDDTKMSIYFNHLGTIVKGGAKYRDNIEFISNQTAVVSGDDIVVSDHIHCICGRSDESEEQIGDHENHSLTVFAPLSQDAVKGSYGGALPLSGSWYLTEDITLTKQAAVNNNLDICLNGHKVYYESEGSDANRILMTGRGTAVEESAVNICDCVGTGEMKKKDTTSKATGAMLFINAQHTTSLNFYGGTFDASEISTTKNGGLLQVTGGNKCTVNVYGGKFIGAKKSLTPSGTIMNLSSGAKLNLYGGEFTCKSGTADDVVGINVPSGTVNISGKVVIDGKNSATLKLGSGAGVNIKDLDTAAKLCIIPTEDKLVIKGAAEYIDQITTSDDYTVSLSGEDVKIVSNNAPHEHCVCGKTSDDATDIGDHKTHTDITYTALDQNAITSSNGGALPLSGSWYLTEDITLTKQAAVNDSLNICLNGHKIYFETSGSDANRIIMSGRGTKVSTSAVNICDCVGTGEMKKKDITSKATGAMLFINAQHTTSLNFFGGTFDASEISTTKNGGLLQVTGGNKCTVNVYGGKFIGAKKSQTPSGTIMNLSSGAKLNLYGGEFTCKSGTADDVVGINVPSGTVKVSGKVIIGGKNSATLKLGSGATLDVKDLDKDAVIYVLPTDEGVFAKGAAEYITRFKTSDEYEISVSGDDLRIDKKS